ncbi:MAG: TetR/AcrR family transcriptional regulator [Firmicutes bacterium]|nr:TetR/AcrR family transcriptional regulator [Bacillota bacterium]
MSPGLRERKRARTKQAIYDAAMRLFAAKGFHETSVDDIAAAAQVSRATLFNYFGTKAGVLRYYSEMLADYLTRSAEEVRSLASPLDRMRRFLEGWLEYTVQHEAEARQVYLFALGDPGSLLNGTPARRSLFSVFQSMVREGQEKQEIRSDLPSEHLAGLILSVYQAAVISFLFAGEPLERLADSAWKFVLHGVAHHPPGR